MKDSACVAFLQWALPILGLRWKGFRRVRRQVCKRIGRRLSALGLPDLDAYRARLAADEAEWRILDSLCRVTVSRFYRDRGVFDHLRHRLLPELVAGAAPGRLHLWSAGCASGEEPYTLSILWRLGLAAARPGIEPCILATDADSALLERARDALYPASALKELPTAWREAAFVAHGARFRLRPEFRRGVEFRCADIRSDLPEGAFHVVLCRNLVFTYFEEALQRRLLDDIAARLRPGGALVIGSHEALPSGAAGLIPCAAAPGVFRKANGGHH